MKKVLYIIACLTTGFCSFGQDRIERQTDSIVAEGKRLYRSEMASWYGTDIFLGQFKTREKIGGYFSYSDNEVNKCIFFSKEETPKVIGTISFDSTYNVQSATSDLSEREFTKQEKDLFTIRSSALKTINSDTIFKMYKNTNFNLIPLITNNEKKVYVLTGPQQNGVVIFGNDYLLNYDDENNLMNRKQLHRNIMSFKYGEKIGDSTEVIGATHTHLPETGDFITATDICTLMLYAKFAKWKQHIVVSANYFSIWNCETNQLAILTKDAMERINADQNSRQKKK